MRRYASAFSAYVSPGHFLPLLIILLAAVTVFLPEGTHSRLTHADGPTVTTDRSEYAAGEIVLISGTRFAPLASLDVVVVRPDGSIVAGDGTETPGWDSVVTDESGAFSRQYQTAWRGKGGWAVNVYDAADSEHTAILATTTFFTSGPQVTTDKPNYEPNETAIITGSGFEPGVCYDIPVTRPDESIITGDGTGTPGWDTVTADSSGGLAYSYELDGLTGPYLVQVQASPWGGPDSPETPLATATFTDMTGDIIIDDLGPGFSKSGGFFETWSGGYGSAGHYYYTWNATSSDEAYVVWRPSIPTTRYYTIVAYIPTPHAWTHSARYKVAHESGTSTMVVDQQRVLGFDHRWPPAGSKLGNYRLTAGTGSYVRLGDATGEPYTTTEIGFDAMLFQPACVYRTEDELRNETQPECRGTFVYDPGVGNLMSRAQLLANASYFISQGWPVNFLWYAPETTKSISTTDAVQWSSCPWGTSPHSGSVCPSSALDFNRVGLLPKVSTVHNDSPAGSIRTV
jgi:hypothetical protein